MRQKRRRKTRPERLYVDRIEGEVAVVVPEGGGPEDEVPVARLPPGTCEGEWLKFTGDATGPDEAIQPFPYERDADETERRRQRVQSLMDELS